MKTIWKFNLLLTTRQTVLMPADAEILDVQKQQDIYVMWALVDTSVNKDAREIVIVGTGDPATDLSARKYITTIQDGALVWHFFDGEKTKNIATMDVW